MDTPVGISSNIVPSTALKAPSHEKTHTTADKARLFGQSAWRSKSFFKPSVGSSKWSSSASKPTEEAKTAESRSRHIIWSLLQSEGHKVFPQAALHATGKSLCLKRFEPSYAK